MRWIISLGIAALAGCIAWWAGDCSSGEALIVAHVTLWGALAEMKDLDRGTP